MTMSRIGANPGICSLSLASVPWPWLREAACARLRVARASEGTTLRCSLKRIRKPSTLRK